MEKTCVSCKKIFTPSPAVSNQQYCSNPKCQKMRKRKWQKEKLATDSDYREAEAKAQKEWSSKNKDYWKEYRKRNPAYQNGTERSRGSATC